MSAGPETPSSTENLIMRFSGASMHTSNITYQMDKGFIMANVSRKFMPPADCHSVIGQLSR